MENLSRVGKYKLEQYLGGSMARVYGARDSVLGRRVYAFGITLYALLAGVMPLMGGSADRIFQAILTEPLDMEPLKALRLPQALNLQIERCTAKQAERRPAGLGEVCHELERILLLPAPPLTVSPEPKVATNGLPKLIRAMLSAGL